MVIIVSYGLDLYVYLEYKGKLDFFLIDRHMRKIPQMTVALLLVSQ